MTIQITFSGHATGDDTATQKPREAKLIEDMKRVVADFIGAGGEVYSATFSSQHHRSGSLVPAQSTEASAGQASLDF